MKRALILALSLVFVSNFAFAQASSELDTVSTQKATLNPELDFTKNDFSFKGKAGFTFSTGNTESLNVNAATETLFRLKRFENKLKAGLFFTDVYETATGEGEGRSAEYYYGIYRLDYYFSQKTTLYVGGGAYVDQISGIQFAGQGFIGMSYWLFRKPDHPTSLRVSAGYNYTYENREAPSENASVHSAQQEINFAHLFNDDTKVTWDVILMENVEVLDDFRAKSDLEFSVKLTKALSAIAGWRVRFDNVPVIGFEKLDMIQDLSLGVEF